MSDRVRATGQARLKPQPHTIESLWQIKARCFQSRSMVH